MHPARRGALISLLLLGAATWAAFLFVTVAPTSPAVAPRLVCGRLVHDGAGVAGATVRYKGTSTQTLTDTAGRFTLPRLAGQTRVTAWKEGFLIAGADRAADPLTLTLEPLPTEDNASYEWVDPAPGRGLHNCANCHATIYQEWKESGHSRSVTGRRFRDLYSGTGAGGAPDKGWGLLTQHPDGAAVCSSCHAPALPAGDEGLFDLRKVQGIAAHGVHCDYCHKVQGVEDPGLFGLSHGRYNLKLLRPAEGRQLFFGPLDDVDRGEDAYSPLYRDSRYCASCHEGVVFGVPVYTTYSEWRESPARREGKHCQHCHMAPTGTMTNVAPGRGGVERDPKTLANHRFFQPSQEAMLKDCLRVSVAFTPKGDDTVVSVTMSADNVGHAVPTGLPDRHLIVVVEGRAAGERPLVGKSDARLPPFAGPMLAGHAGRVYAKLLHDRDDERITPAPFWRAAPEVEDNRLRPGQPDRFAVAYPRELQSIRVRVLYGRFWPEVARAKGWEGEPTVVIDRVFGAP